jgi:hypothetical protein
VDDSLEEYFSPSLLMIPFLFHDEPPRPVIGVNSAVQGICKPRVDGSSAIVQSTPFEQIVSSPMYHSVRQTLGKGQTYDHTLPGVPLVMLFMNSIYNYEDCVIVNKKVVE